MTQSIFLFLLIGIFFAVISEIYMKLTASFEMSNFIRILLVIFWPFWIILLIYNSDK